MDKQVTVHLNVDNQTCNIFNFLKDQYQWTRPYAIRVGLRLLESLTKAKNKDCEIILRDRSGREKTIILS